MVSDATLGQRRLEAALASAGMSDARLIDHALARLEPLLAPLLAPMAGASMLDFGAGRGALSRRLAQHPGLAVHAADITARPDDLDPGVIWHQADLNQPLPLEPGRFDLLAAVEVIEHLENPRATFREWHRLLKPGGHLYFSTPNNDSWRAIASLAIKGHFQLFTDASYPAHITALLAKDIERILSETGFRALGYGHVLPSRLIGSVTWSSLLPFWRVGKRTALNVSVIAQASR